MFQPDYIPAIAYVPANTPLEQELFHCVTAVDALGADTTTVLAGAFVRYVKARDNDTDMRVVWWDSLKVYDVEYIR